MQNLTGILIILILLVLSVVFAWKQRQTLRWLKTQEQMPRDDRSYFRRQAYLRLVESGLMMILAGLFIGFYFIDTHLERFLLMGADAKDRGVAPPLDVDDRAFLNFGLVYVFIFVIVVLLLLAVAFMDLSAIRRYGMRHRRRIRDARRSLLERELPLLRRSRNGHP